MALRELEAGKVADVKRQHSTREARHWYMRIACEAQKTVHHKQPESTHEAQKSAHPKPAGKRNYQSKINAAQVVHSIFPLLHT